MVGRNPNSTTQPACAFIEPWWSLFATATILIVGGSTGRQMLDSFVEQHVSLTARSMLKTGRCDTFNVIDPKFGNVVSNWSRRVHACTAPAMEAAGVGCADCVCTCRSPDWTDITATAMLKETWRGATIRFSWKPQLMTRADEAAFTRRLCHEEPLPDLVVVTKGLHDVYFLPKPTLAAHFDHVRRAFERFAQLLECFPSATAIVVRAPMDGLRRLRRPGSTSASAGCPPGRTRWGGRGGTPEGEGARDKEMSGSPPRQWWRRKRPGAAESWRCGER